MILSQLDFTRPAFSRVHFGSGLLNSLGTLVQEQAPSKVALLADSHVFRLHGECLLTALPQAVTPLVLEIPVGERSKSRGTVEELQDRLLEEGFDRNSLILGFGGGVTLDIAGYVAATLLRGIRWFSLPTSLLAQVDAGIGGKTGVNIPAGKNLVGAFHPPVEVLIDPDMLGTLDPLHMRNGLAEAIKHGWISSADLFKSFEDDVSGDDRPPSADLLQRAVAIKCAVVEEDPFEKGRRAILNAGHTVAHAVEAASGHTIPHGFAVALGLAVEADIARSTVSLPDSDFDRLLNLLRGARLVPDTEGMGFDTLLPFLKTDKKNVAGEIRLALPAAVGKMATVEGSWTVPVDLDLLRDAWERRP